MNRTKFKVVAINRKTALVHKVGKLDPDGKPARDADDWQPVESPSVVLLAGDYRIEIPFDGRSFELGKDYFLELTPA